MTEPLWRRFNTVDAVVTTRVAMAPIHAGPALRIQRLTQDVAAATGTAVTEAAATEAAQVATTRTAMDRIDADRMRPTHRRMKHRIALLGGAAVDTGAAAAMTHTGMGPIPASP